MKTRKPRKKKLSGPAIRHYTIQISGMHCQNCVSGVTNAINALDGAAAQVSLKKQTAEVDCDREVSSGDLRRAVEEAGFTVDKITEGN